MTRLTNALLLALAFAPGTVAAQALAAPVEAAGPAPCGACASALRVGFSAAPLRAVGDTGERRHAIEYSDAYATRLAIHRYASYVEIPLFVAEYLLGEKLLRDRRNGFTNAEGEYESEGGAHGAVAAGLGALFAVNTITGGWNLWDSRKDPAGRTRRWLHTITMLAADAGFLWTAAAIRDAQRSDAGARTHRQRAVFSMSLATASTIMMWLWKD